MALAIQKQEQEQNARNAREPDNILLITARFRRRKARRKVSKMVARMVNPMSGLRHK